VTQIKIINVMLGRGLGGIEQAAIDYAEGLQAAKGDVLCITAPDAAINHQIIARDYALTHLAHHGSWDIFAARRLSQIISRFGAEVILTHGNRALQLAHKANKQRIPLLAVSHNYHLQHLGLADAVLCITQHMVQEVRTAHPKFTTENSFHIPNMLPYTRKYQPRQFHAPVRIGTMGRMIQKKGFSVWLKALARLKEQGIQFEGWIAGDGEERAELEQLSTKLALDKQVKFLGWVEKKETFFEGIDIFCIPSLEEPFGIVTIEAMHAGLPVVASRTVGSCEILTSPEIGVLVDIGSPDALCAGLNRLLASPERAIAMGHAAHLHVVNHYHKQIISQQIMNIIEEII
jgi:glycosyltransferase involved in cell wall biosynthesis